jgi:hypothetical protein
MADRLEACSVPPRMLAQECVLGTLPRDLRFQVLCASAELCELVCDLDHDSFPSVACCVVAVSPSATLTPYDGSTHTPQFRRDWYALFAHCGTGCRAKSINETNG